MGLEAAHNNNIIHRDIKPQNIIISKEGKVKVTDFGIAKAATSNTITSNVMGSVHYTSPEQARGGYSDAKSDIYSLGITLYEMLTGRVPFNGDTTVAIAIKHIQEELQTPKVYNEDIPISVEKIVLKCCQKSPDRRYQSAQDLITDLKRSLITPDEDFVDLVDPDEEGATRIASEDEEEEIRTGGTGRISNTEQMRLNRDVIKEAREEKRRSSRDYDNRDKDRDRDYDNEDSRRKRRSRQDRYDRDYDDDFDDEDDGYNSKLEKITVAIAILAAILVGVIVIMLVGKYFGIFEFDSSESAASASSSASITADSASGIVIPDVVGQSYAEAVSNLQAKGFTVSKASSDKNTASSGVVESMSPSGGTSAESGATITLYVSDGSNATSTTTDTATSTTSEDDSTVSVPKVVGLDSEEACLVLIEAGLTPGEVIDTTNEDASLTGLICAQSIAFGTSVSAGTIINMELSIGPASVTYSYNADISAPTEGENYTYGIPVKVTLVTSDGTTLLSTTTSDFPVQGTYKGITSPTGTITFVYTATTPTTTNAETGETTGGESVEYTVTRAVTFTQES